MDIKKLAEEVNAKADVGADSLLDKAKGSKWTAAILLGAALIVIVFIAL